MLILKSALALGRPWLLLVLCGLEATRLPAFAESLPPQRPNLLVILSDDHSKPHVGCYDNPEVLTPNLDRFAAEGMRLDRAYVASPQCVPSRAAIMTGRSVEDTALKLTTPKQK